MEARERPLDALASTPFLLVLARRMVPLMDADAEKHFLALIGEALAPRPPSLRRQLALFLRVLRWLPVLRFGSRFDRLTPERQDRVLRWFHRCPVVALRQGFWGVKTLIFMGYYGRPEVGPSLHYAPSRTGNERLHA